MKAQTITEQTGKTQLNTQELNISEDEELLTKIYDKNLDKITSYTKTMQYSMIISFFSCLSFFIMLSIKFSPAGNFSFLYLLIPIAISLISILIAFNMMTVLQTLLSNAECSLENKVEPEGNSSLPAQILVNLTGISLIAFTIVLFLRLEKYTSTETDLNLIFVPAYFALICSLAMAVFISPGFFKGEMYFELGLIFIHIVSIGSFFFLLCYKVNVPESMRFAHVFVPYYFSVGAQLIYSIGVNFIDKKEDALRKHIINSLSVACLLCAGILIQVFLDAERKDNYFISAILYLAAFLGFTLESTIVICKEVSEDNSEDERSSNTE